MEKIIYFSKIINDRKSKFQAAGVKIKNEKEAEKVIEFIEKKNKNATHNIYAFRIKKNNKIVENKNDDGESGAGSKILKYMQFNEIVNFVIIVSRWYGGIHLGPARFKHITETIKDLLKNIKNQENR